MELLQAAKVNKTSRSTAHVESVQHEVEVHSTGDQSTIDIAAQV